MGGQFVFIIFNNILIVVFWFYVQNVEQLDGNQYENIEISCEYVQEYIVFKGFINEYFDFFGFKFFYLVFLKFEKEWKIYIIIFYLILEFYVYQVLEKLGSLL